MTDKKLKIQEEPAWGERNAVTGYYPQYRVSAALVISSLRSSDLRWIAVADPQAKRVDDFQIAVGNRVDAYQFKWSRFPGNFTFNDLVKGDDATPSLIKQLAEGWQHLQKLHASERVVVHLMTNETMSVSTGATLPTGDPPPEQPHFAAFIEQVWKLAHITSLSSRIEIPAVWQVTWDSLQTASGLSKTEFELFVRDCKLEFGCNLPKAENTTSRDAEIYENDLNHVTEKIFRAVYEPEHIVRLDHKKLLDFLGWTRRFEFRNRHDFPVNEILYQPIEDSWQELERALERTESGYLAVLGSPGSGKSTLLTQTLLYHPQRIIRYYAFVPDAQGANVRGESQNFLHDLVGAIEREGFRAGLSPGAPDVGQLRERIHEQLRLLHQDWLKTNRKTIILVDGLDHIPREQRPIRSLLKDLPLPEQIPPGVLFVLGSQTDELSDLPTAVLTAIRRPERRIEIKSLNREAIQRIVEKTDAVNFLTAEQITEIERLSSGHPLALIYLLRLLEEADGSEAASEILHRAEPYDGKIEDYYQSLWRKIDEDDELADLLGLMARMRGGADVNWVRSWAEKPLVRRLQRTFAHLFRVEKNGKWYFFHNSFRLFLIDRTVREPHGSFDEARDREIHLELAAKYAESDEAYRQWEEIYHLYQGGADNELLRKANPALFREQFFKFRSPEAIRADILLAIRAAGRRSNLVALVRLMLADAEAAQRESNTERLPIVPNLIALGETSAALEYLRDGTRLRVTQKLALDNSIALDRRGLRQEAIAVFELGEPLEYLSGAKDLRDFYDRDEHELLEAWAKAAVHFRPIEKIFKTIRQVTVETERFARHAVAEETDDGEAVIAVEERPIEEMATKVRADAVTLKLKSELLYAAGLELLAENRWDDLESVKSQLLADENEGRNLCFSLQVFSWRFCVNQGDAARAKRILSETIERIDSFQFDDSKRIVIAEAIFTVFGDKSEAQRWLEKARPLTPLTFPDFQVSFWHFRTLLRHARLLYAFGDTRSAAELIPMPANLKEQAGAFCQRGVCAIAEISAAAWRGQPLDRWSLRQKTFQLLRLFNNHSRIDDREDWSAWYPFISGIKDEFYEQLVDAVALNGAEAVQDLADDFTKEWKNNRRFWEIETIRQITLALYKKGASKEWTVASLENLAELIAHEETYPRVEKSAALAFAWTEIGEPQPARDTLLRTLLDSSSTGEKDYQLNSWLEWMQRVNRVEPEKAQERAAWFAAAILVLERNGGPAASAAYELLEIVFEWSPRRAVKLFSWFIEKGIVRFDDAARSLLRAALNSSANAGVPEVAVRILYEFILPFAKPDEGIVRLIATRLLKRNGKESFLKFAREFLGKAKILALPKHRRIWSRYIAEFLLNNDIPLTGVGLNEEVLKAEEGYSTSRLELKDGTSLTEAEVRRRCQNLEELRELMEQKVGSYYHWREVVENLLPKLKNTAEVFEVAQYFSGAEDRMDAPIINRLAARLLELGDAENAKILARSVLAVSERSGWSAHLSGGTKIEAYKTLVKIEGDAMRWRAFEDLIYDLSGDYRYTSSIVRDLDEILPVLTAQVPEKEIWSEVEQYVGNIFPSVKAEEIDSVWLELADENEIADTAENALTDFVCLHISHPINLLAYAGQFVFLDLTLLGDRLADDALNRLLLGNEREQEAASMILDAASVKNADIIKKFEKGLQTLAASPNMSLRFVAQKLLSKIRISVSLRQRPNLESLTLFDFELPPGRALDEAWRTNTAKTEMEFLPETTDSYQLLRIVLMELEAVSSWTGLPRENLVERAAQIFADLAAKDEWSLLGEQKMRSRFNVADLKYPYRRPRATMARYALFHLIAEIFDSGFLPVEHLDRWKWILEHYDPETFFLRPETRPDFAGSISGWGQRNFIKRPSPEIAEQVKLFTEDGLVLFGEYTRVKSLEWETPTVVRQAMICSENFNPRNDRYRFFPSQPILQIADYSSRVADGARDSTLIWHWERMPDSPQAEWLAFNPELARSLGWKPSAEKPFAWADGGGELMVWSVFWRDGLFEEQPPEFHNEVGEGIAVVGTPRAFEEIKNHLKTPLKQKIRIEEEWRVDGEEHKNPIVFEREIPES